MFQHWKISLKGTHHDTASNQALLLDYPATMEQNTEKAIKREEETLTQIKEIKEDNAQILQKLYPQMGVALAKGILASRNK